MLHRLINRYRKSHARKEIGTCQTGRPGTNDSCLLFMSFGLFFSVSLDLQIAKESLDGVYIDGSINIFTCTLRFAIMETNPACYGGERHVFADQIDRLFYHPLFQEINIAPHIYAGGACRFAGRKLIFLRNDCIQFDEIERT